MVEFQLLRPLWLLAIIPLVYLVWRLWRCQPTKQDWTGICDQHLLSRQLEAGNLKSSSVILYLSLAWMLAVVALAGPSWNERQQPATLSGNARIIVLDLSAAMTPQQKAKLTEILRVQDSPVTALIAFAEYPYLIAPLTNDLNTLAAVIPDLSPEAMPMPGYRLDRALSLAQQLLTENIASEGEILIMTAGGDSENHALTRAVELVSAQYRVSVLSLQRSSQLEQLAQISGGNFALLTPDNQDIELLLSHSNANHNRGDTRVVTREDSGLWLLLVLLPVAALSFRRGWLGSVLLPLVTSSLLILPTGTVVAGQSISNSQAIAKQAQDAYFDGDYVKAKQLWQQLTTIDAQYNRANALVRLGRYKNALVVYQKVMIQAPEHQDARINHDLVVKFLEQPEQYDNSDSEDNDQQQSDNGGNSRDGGKDNDQQRNQNKTNSSSDNNSQQQSAGSDKTRANSASSLNSAQANQQQLVRWLDKVPDLQGSFLRQKLLRQHKRREYPDIKGDN